MAEWIIGREDVYANVRRDNCFIRLKAKARGEGGGGGGGGGALSITCPNLTSSCDIIYLKPPTPPMKAK